MPSRSRSRSQDPDPTSPNTTQSHVRISRPTNHLMPRANYSSCYYLCFCTLLLSPRANYSSCYYLCFCTLLLSLLCALLCREPTYVDSSYVQVYRRRDNSSYFHTHQYYTHFKPEFEPQALAWLSGTASAFFAPHVSHVNTVMYSTDGTHSRTYAAPTLQRTHARHTHDARTTHARTHARTTHVYQNAARGTQARKHASTQARTQARTHACIPEICVRLRSRRPVEMSRYPQYPTVCYTHDSTVVEFRGLTAERCYFFFS